MLTTTSEVRDRDAFVIVVAVFGEYDLFSDNITLLSWTTTTTTRIRNILRTL